MRSSFSKVLQTLTAVVVLSLLTAGMAMAHCDTLDGPVVIDAKAAIDKGDIAPVLKWIKKQDEPEVKSAFQKALAVRGTSPQARELADTYFFETLVRIHRAGEGAPYTGLKPAGIEVDPAVEKADKAIETGSVDELVKSIGDAVAAGIRSRFAKVEESRKHASHNVEAGRNYVAAYVDFIHYVERLNQDAQNPTTHHAEPGEGKAEHKHQ